MCQHIAYVVASDGTEGTVKETSERNQRSFVSLSRSDRPDGHSLYVGVPRIYVGVFTASQLIELTTTTTQNTLHYAHACVYCMMEINITHIWFKNCRYTMAYHDIVLHLSLPSDLYQQCDGPSPSAEWQVFLHKLSSRLLTDYRGQCNFCFAEKFWNKEQRIFLHIISLGSW